MPFLKKKTNCYCAFCRTPRRIYSKRNIGFINIFYAVLASFVTMYCFWQRFDPRFLVILAIFLGLTESFIQIRWRLSVFCKQCGFDPVLYLKDPEKAAAKVKEQLAKRREDPALFLAKPLNLPALPPERVPVLKNKEKRGAVLSRQV